MTQRRLRRDGRLGGFLLPFSETENGPRTAARIVSGGVISCPVKRCNQRLRLFAGHVPLFLICATHIRKYPLIFP